MYILYYILYCILYYNSVSYDYDSINLLLRDNVCDVKQ